MDKAFNKRFRYELQRRHLSWPQVPRMLPEPPLATVSPAKPSGALAAIAQGRIGASGLGAFNETGFMVMVRRLSAYQTQLQLSDAAFVKHHPKLGSATSWRMLCLLAGEKEPNLWGWFRRLTEQCVELEAKGVRWDAQTLDLPAGRKASRMECQEMFLALESHRTAEKITLATWCRDYRAYTGDPATWIRMRKGRWELVSTSKRLPMLRALARMVII